MRAVRALAALLVLAGGLFIGARAIPPAPALGAFLEPAHGVWSLARAAALDRSGSSRVGGLGEAVQVVYDERGVPHIFARSEDDAYRALGYVVARDRLFQLYVQTLAASGRLTEIGGAPALDLDREMRRLGLPRAAERRVTGTPDTSATMRAARAYADGINAYVAEMPREELPLEFRLLGKRPPRWEPIDTYHLLNRMGWTLAYLALEHDRAAAAALVGAEAAAQLFPDDSPIQEPIQPNGARAPRFDTRPLPPPGKPDSASLLVASASDAFLPGGRLARAGGDGDDPARWMASNNWAVSPSRSATKHALLAGDPHLDLSLPSLWYEAHLVVPGVLDVYGATLPGAPAVVIGFNRDVAWTLTNTGADVMDLYSESVDDARRPTRYRVDGEWRPLERRIETYRGTRGETVAVDTIYFSHRGPLQRVRGRWLSMRWTVLESGRELDAFLGGARARSASAFQDAMSAAFRAPAQNMLAADRGGHITVRSVGRFPVRPGDGSGSRLFDGTTSASDWTGDVPVAGWPQSIDPPQGYLASANQQPIDPTATRVWMGGNWDPWRALRINALLRADSVVTVDDMRRFQTDPGSARADHFVPIMIAAARRVGARGSSSSPRALDEAARVLARWDRRYTGANTAAVLFEAALRETAVQAWDELTAGQGGRRLTPASAVLARLMADSASAWWDDRATAQIEDRDAILASALVAALQSTQQRYGPDEGDAWRWSGIRRANIHHLLRIPALSALELPVEGGPGTLSPSAGNGTHGASWRMVVDLADTPHAWTTYPGGQSGNPASARYRDRIPHWLAGQLEAVHVPATPEALPTAQRSGTLELRPARSER